MKVPCDGVYISSWKLVHSRKLGWRVKFTRKSQVCFSNCELNAQSHLPKLIENTNYLLFA